MRFVSKIHNFVYTSWSKQAFILKNIFWFQEASMTRILITIVILFIICQGIKLVPDMYEVYKCSTGDVWVYNSVYFLFFWN